MDNSNNTIIGKDVIESLTLGMYDDAKIIYREYIQNSADQIDKAVSQGIFQSIDEGRIWITIDKNIRQIVIEDNATGISSKEAVSLLKNIAQSTKQRGVDKGFRGIGRLGGLAYCDKLIFETSCKGEDCKTIIEWDANKLKCIINNRHSRETASEVIDEITSILEEKEELKKHYFKITLSNIVNDALLKVADIREYLSMVTPATFDHKFTFFSKIEDYRNSHNIMPDEYRIFVNEEELYKAYSTRIYESTGESKKEIKDIKFFHKSSNSGKLLYWGWYGLWSFEKQIPEKNIARGIRLRKHNIQIGDEYSLVKLYKIPDKRWNVYTFGEVYALHPDLIPNARRDYFLENDVLKEFEASLREILNEFYDHIYFSSNVRSAQRDISKLNAIEGEISKKEHSFFDSPQEKIELDKKRQEQNEKAEQAKKSLLKYSESSKENEVKKRIFKELIKDEPIVTTGTPLLIKTKTESEDVHSTYKRDKVKIRFIDENLLSHLSKEEKKLIKKVFDVVNSCLPDKKIVENIYQKIIEEFKSGKKENG